MVGGKFVVPCAVTALHACAVAMFQPDELYVTNIPGNATDEEVQALFAQHGTVREYVVVSKRKEANLAQAALVRMEDHAGALAARKALNRFDLHGKQLNVRW